MSVLERARWVLLAVILPSVLLFLLFYSFLFIPSFSPPPALAGSIELLENNTFASAISPWQTTGIASWEAGTMHFEDDDSTPKHFGELPKQTPRYFSRGANAPGLANISFPY